MLVPRAVDGLLIARPGTAWPLSVGPFAYPGILERLTEMLEQSRAAAKARG